MLIKPEWWEWVVLDDNGISGISDDAPDDMKAAFEEFQKSITVPEGQIIKL